MKMQHQLLMAVVFVLLTLPFVASAQDCSSLWRRAIESDRQLAERVAGASGQCLRQQLVRQREACWSKQSRRGHDVPAIAEVANGYNAAINACSEATTLRVSNARFLMRVGEFCDAASEFAAVRLVERLSEESDAWLGCSIRASSVPIEGTLIEDALNAHSALTGPSFEALRTKHAAAVLQNWLTVLTLQASRRSVISSQADYLLSLSETDSVWIGWTLLLDRAGAQWALSAQTLLTPSREYRRLVQQLTYMQKTLSGN